MKFKNSSLLKCALLGALLSVGSIASVSNVVETQATAIINFSASEFSGGTSGTGSNVSLEKNGVTVSCDKGYATTEFRCYSGGAFSVTSTSGDIQTLSFVFGEKKGDFYSGGLDQTIENINSSTFTYTLESQLRILSLEVTIDGDTQQQEEPEPEEPTEQTGDKVYSIVSDISELNDNDKVLMAYGEKVNAGISSTGKYLDAVDATLKDDNLLVDTETAKPIILNKGKVDGTYTLKLGDKYIAPNGADIKLQDSTFDWNVNVENNVAQISSENNVFKYNTSSPRFKTYTSTTMGDISLYKEGSDVSRVILENSTVSGNKGGTATVSIKETKGIDEISSYLWEIVDGSEFISLNGEVDKSNVNIDLLAEGTAHVKITVNGSISATATIVVSDYKYDFLNETEYFISNIDGKGILAGDLTNNVNANFESDEDVWTFEKSFTADNSYWLKKGNMYLTFSKDANLGGSGSAIKLGENKVNSWTISKNGNNYKVETICKDGKTRSLAQNKDDLKWYAFEGDNYVSLITKGALEYDHYEIVQAPKLASYFVGDDFSKESVRTGLVVVAIYKNGFKEDITNKVDWGLLKADGTVEGTILINGQEITVVVSNIGVYIPQNMLVTGIKDTYLVGEEVNGLSVSVTYKKDTFETTRNISEDKYTISPKIISEGTTSIKVTLKIDENIAFEKNITVKPNKWVQAAILGEGDEIVLTSTYGTHSYEAKYTETTNYTKLDGQVFEFAPTGEVVFELENAGSNAFYLKDKSTNQYLNTSVDNVLSFGKPGKIESQDGKFKNFKFKPSDSQNMYTCEYLTYNSNSETWNGTAYTDSTYYDYYELEMIADAETAILSLTHVDFNAQTEVPCEDIEFKVFNYSPLILIDPWSTTVGSKTAFNLIYNEAESEEEDPWWDMTWSGGYISFNGTKFTTENDSSYQDLMIYRNKDIELKATVLSLSAKSLYGEELKVKQGEEFDWSSVVVTANYDNGSHSKVAFGSYQISGLDTSIPGKKVVTITYGNASTTIEILVTGKVDNILIINNEKQLTDNFFLGNTIKLKTNVSAPEGEPFKWSSLNPDIVSVDQEGNITALKVGTTEITVQDYYELVGYTVTVNVRAVATGIELVSDELTVNTGNTIKPQYNILPLGSTGTLSWSSDDENIALVRDGIITGINPGTTTITVILNDKFTDSLEVIVVAQPVVSISISESAKTLLEGESFTLRITFNPTNAYYKDLVWTSLNEEVATVEDGLVTALKEGKAVIKATTKDGKFFKTCTVTVKSKVVEEEKKEEKKGCSGSITASSILTSIFTLSGVCLLINKRKKD